MTQHKYIITIHDSTGQQIKNVDFIIDYPLDFIQEVEYKTNIDKIHPMGGAYIPHYMQLSIDNLDIECSDIDGEEYDSIWFCETDKHVEFSYNIKYNGSNYIVEFHRI